MDNRGWGAAAANQVGLPSGVVNSSRTRSGLGLRQGRFFSPAGSPLGWYPGEPPDPEGAKIARRWSAFRPTSARINVWSSCLPGRSVTATSDAAAYWPSCGRPARAPRGGRAGSRRLRAQSAFHRSSHSGERPRRRARRGRGAPGRSGWPRGRGRSVPRAQTRARACPRGGRVRDLCRCGRPARLGTQTSPRKALVSFWDGGPVRVPAEATPGAEEDQPRAADGTISLERTAPAPSASPDRLPGTPPGGYARPRDTDY